MIYELYHNYIDPSETGELIDWFDTLEEALECKAEIAGSDSEGGDKEAWIESYEDLTISPRPDNIKEWDLINERWNSDSQEWGQL